jgi:hypothetical protein
MKLHYRSVFARATEGSEAALVAGLIVQSIDVAVIFDSASVILILTFQ